MSFSDTYNVKIWKIEQQGNENSINVWRITFRVWQSLNVFVIEKKTGDFARTVMGG